MFQSCWFFMACSCCKQLHTESLAHVGLTPNPVPAFCGSTCTSAALSYAILRGTSSTHTVRVSPLLPTHISPAPAPGLHCSHPAMHCTTHCTAELPACHCTTHCTTDPPAEPSSSDDEDSGDASSAAGSSKVHASSSVGSNLDDMQPPPGVSWKKSKAKKKQVRLCLFHGCCAAGSCPSH